MDATACFMGAVGATACVAAGCGTGEDLDNIIPVGPTDPDDKGAQPGGPDPTGPGVDPETVPPTPPPAEADYKNLLLARTTFGATDVERAALRRIGPRSVPRIPTGLG